MTETLYGLLHPGEWRHAAQRLLRSPLFSVAVVGLLGSGLAALLTLAAAVSSLRLQALPYPQGDRLAEVRGWSPSMGASLGYAPGLLERLEQLPQVDALAVYDFAAPLETEAGDLLPSARAGEGLLPLLGARPLHGRLLGAGDAGSDAVLLSESAWRARFAADPGVIGRRIVLARGDATVVGVVAEPFRFPSRDTAVWSLLELTPEARGSERFNFGAVQALVRLADGATPEALEAAVAAQFAAEPGLAPMREFLQLVPQVQHLRERWAGSQDGTLLLLGAAVLLVLLMLAANLAGLWLERALRRRRDLAVRSALGAGSGRMAAGALAEVLLLGVAALLLALALVPAGVAVLESLGLLDASTPWRAGLDWPVVLLAALLLLALGGLLSAGPLWVARRVGAADLHGASRSLGQGLGHGRQALVTVQVALAVTLMAGAALLGGSLLALLGEDPGFQPEGLLMARMVDHQHDHDSMQARSRALLRDIAAMPGVQQVSFSNAAPFSQSESVSSYARPDAPEQPLTARDRVVGAQYFQTLGVALEQGRGFNQADVADGTALVVDRRFAQQVFGGSAALGQRLSLPSAPGTPSQYGTVVGVAATVRHASLDEQPDLGTVYRVSDAPQGDGPSLLVRMGEGGAGKADAIRSAAAAHGLRLSDLQAAGTVLRSSLSQRIPLLRMVLGFAAAGVLLAAVGLFALIAFSVQRRRNEFGLRLAIGASPAALRLLALRDALRVLVPGLLAGGLGALLAGCVLASQLHEVSPTDPLLLGLALLGTGLALLPACAWPAWRAARLDPTSSLRCD